MKVVGKGFISDCTERTKPNEKGDFTYYLVQVVGMGIDETFFSLNEVQVTEKEVEFILDIKNGKVTFVGLKK